MIRRGFPFLLALALAATACGGSSEPMAGGTPTADATADGSGGAGGAGSGGTGSGGAGTSDGGSSGGGTGATGPRAPVAGTYRYSTAIDLGAEGQYAGSRTLSYFPPEGNKLVVRQITQISGSPPREWWFRYGWRPNGLFRVFEVEPTGNRCTFDPPLRELRFPVRVGDSFTSSSLCDEDHFPYRLSVEVTGKETVTVDGSQIEAFIVRRELKRGDAEPLLETHWFSPEHRLLVRMATKGSGAPLDLQDTLISLEPDGLPPYDPPDGF